MAGANDFFEEVGRQSADSLRALGDAATRGTRSVQDFAGSVTRVSASIGALGALFKIPPVALAGLGGVLAGGAIGAGAGLAGAASPNGLQSVDKAFEVLSGTIGSTLLPGFVALGGVALVAADSVRAWVAEHRVSIIEAWVNALVIATEAAKEFAKAAAGTGNVIGGGFKIVGGVLSLDMNQVMGGVAQAAVGGINAVQGGIGVANAVGIGGGAGVAGGAGGKNADFLGKLADKMDMIAKDMQSSLGTSGMTDPASKWKEVAIQIQKSDLEIRKMTMFAESMQLVRDFIAELRKQNAPRPAILGRGG